MADKDTTPPASTYLSDADALAAIAAYANPEVPNSALLVERALLDYNTKSRPAAPLADGPLSETQTASLRVEAASSGYDPFAAPPPDALPAPRPRIVTETVMIQGEGDQTMNTMTFPAAIGATLVGVPILDNQLAQQITFDPATGTFDATAVGGFQAGVKFTFVYVTDVGNLSGSSLAASGPYRLVITPETTG